MDNAEKVTMQIAGITIELRLICEGQPALQRALHVAADHAADLLLTSDRSDESIAEVTSVLRGIAGPVT